MEGNENINTFELNSAETAVLPSPRNKFRPAPILIGSAVVVLVSAIFATAASVKKEPAQEVYENTATEEATPDPFLSLDLEAKAAYVYDLNADKVLYEKNSEFQLPLASLVKLMTAVAGSEEVPLYTLVQISPSDLREEGDSGFRVNERLRMDDLIKFTLTRSSNDGAAAIATVVGSELVGLGTSETASEKNSSRVDREAFVALMNVKAASLGLSQTYFLNPTGLDHSETESGGYGSAKDVTNLFSYILRRHPNLLQPTSGETFLAYSTDEIQHEARNTNPKVKTIPGLIGSKTGYTDLAGGNLVIAFDAGIARPVIIAVLGSTEEGRFRDVDALYWAALKKIGQE